jgi:predicted nucleotidyltransferase
MITFSQIQQVSDEIARRFQPERIILFGSYAYGTPTEDSDVDLLVVMPFEGRSAAKSIEIRQAAYAGFAMDLLVYTPAYLQQRIAWSDFFLIEITEKGKVLYAADYAGVGG